jgi:predicted transglutaminase-like cysteine proteinase
MAAAIVLFANPAMAAHRHHDTESAGKSPAHEAEQSKPSRHRHADAKPDKPKMTTFEASRPFEQASDRDRASALASAWQKHEHGKLKPPGWSDAVQVIRAEPDPMTKLAMADAYVDSRIRYIDRDAVDAAAHRAPGPWALTPVVASKGGGLCRDFATAKAFLLLDAGFPAADIRVVTIEPGAGHPRYHVVLAARVAGKSYVLDMLKGDQARGGYAIPATAHDLTGTTDRVVVAAVAPAAWGADKIQVAQADSGVPETEAGHDLPPDPEPAPAHHRRHHKPHP